MFTKGFEKTAGHLTDSQKVSLVRAGMGGALGGLLGKASTKDHDSRTKHYGSVLTGAGAGAILASLHKHANTACDHAKIKAIGNSSKKYHRKAKLVASVGA